MSKFYQMIPKQKSFFRIIKKPKKISISESLLNYVLNNLISVIYTAGALLTILVIFFYCSNLSVPFSPQFNFQSSFYPFIVLPIVVILLFIGFIFLFFSPAYFGYWVFKDIYEKFGISESGFKKAKINLFRVFYLPSIILLSSLFWLPFMFKRVLPTGGWLEIHLNGILSLCWFAIFPIIMFICGWFRLKKIGFKVEKIIFFGINFYFSLILFYIITGYISGAASNRIFHLELVNKYISIIFILFLVVSCNHIISFEFL